jgi:hypothetical protein
VGRRISRHDAGARFLVDHLAKDPFKDSPPGAEGYQLVIARAELTSCHRFKKVDMVAADRDEAIDCVRSGKKECARRRWGTPGRSQSRKLAPGVRGGRAASFSIRITRYPAREKARVAASPAMPAPMTATLSLWRSTTRQDSYTVI